MITQVITLSPEIQSGAPVFSGTDVPIKNLFCHLRGGGTIEDFLKDFPSVKKEQADQLLVLMQGLIARSQKKKK